MKKITSNVYIEDQYSVPPEDRGCNPGLVVTSEGVVMIDTPMLPGDAAKWLDIIAKRGDLLYIINTHHHIDHIAGNFFFPGTVVSHEGVKKLFAAPVMGILGDDGIKEVAGTYMDSLEYVRLLIEKHDPEGPSLPEGYQLREPTITFSEDLSLYVGQHTFELIKLPGHTQSHIGVYIPQERVFFSGDNFCNRVQPSLAESSPINWVKSLRQIENMDIDLIVPGHGEVCEKNEVKNFRLFVQKCIKIVREAIREGMGKKEAADTISFEALYPRNRHALALHAGQVMQRSNVLRLYEMLSN